MNKKLSATLILILLFLVLFSFSGCVRENEVCNYDSICTANETDNCADCQNVLGRAVDVPKKYVEKDFVP